ncbi:MAG: 3-oxoadipate enol-lactonase [Actinomycetota bacterium]|nr:3-oxoadipate enol-lactonase [Actinomycetota bacterium]
MTPIAVHHEVTGPPQAPVVLLSGSLGTSLSMWDPVVPLLAEHFRVVRYDHRGHGRSPVPPGRWTIDDLGCDAIALLDRLGVQRAHVVGLSVGGMVGMWLAAAAPDRVAGLVAMCTSAHLEPRAAWAERARLVEERGMSAVADIVLERWFTPAFRRLHPERVEAVRQSLLATPVAGYAACCRAIESMDLRPLLPRICTDVLAVAAEQDPATPAVHAHRIAAAVPAARVVVIPRAAHLASVEQPEVTAELVLRHFGAVPAGAQR